MNVSFMYHDDNWKIFLYTSSLAQCQDKMKKIIFEALYGREIEFEMRVKIK